MVSSLALLLGCSEKPKEDERVVAKTYPWTDEAPTWKADIVIEGPQEDQDAVRSFIYHLRRNVGPDRLGPFGKTNEKYGHRVFWDADVWVFPALALLDPETARAVPDFRISTAQYAQIETCRGLGARFAGLADRLESAGHDRPSPDGPLSYAWESGPRGDEGSTAPTARQEHVSAGVVWGLRLASDLGLADPTRVDDIGRAVAHYYVHRSTGANNRREITNVVSVDEWAETDNCLYTNLAAAWVVREYLDPSVRFALPRDRAGELVAYQGDPRRAYQQAAAPLALWPLEREDLVAEPIAFIERFEGKEAPNGPAMSLSLYALLRARHGDADRALETWRESWRRYTDDDLEFRERPGRDDLAYFNTGAAGCLNAVVYGFIGARVVDAPRDDDARIALKNGRWLVFRPNLPSEWRKVTLKGAKVLGSTFDVVCEGRKATVVPR